MADKKRFKLKEIKDVQGRPFRVPIRDDEGNPIMELRKDSEGNKLMQIPRDAKGMPVPNCQPEPVYRVKTRVLEKDALPELLKGIYLTLPADKLTRQDTITGTRMFSNIAEIKDGILELDADVHKWVREKLQDEAIGLKTFGVDLAIVEDAVDDFERLHEPKGEK